MTSKTRAAPIVATTLHLDELVARALAGRIRIPEFQRGIKWKASDVQMLFDSIYRGFPIGTLITWQRPASAATVHIGPVEVPAGQMEDAWWVVDGQQRLTSLVASLCHPSPNPIDGRDPFVVFFDLEEEVFIGGGRGVSADRLLVPLYRAQDAGDFQDWLFEFVEKTNRRDLVAVANTMATRIRNYRVPVYVVEGEGAEVAQEIFVRLNTAGRRMEVHEVFSSLAAPTTSADLKPEAIAQRLGRRLGPLHPDVVMRAALAIGGRDVARLPQTNDSAPEREALMAATERAMGRALDFLAADVGLPHLRLLPHRSTPIVVLAKFFHHIPEPLARSRTRLVRWIWRGFFADALGSDARTLRRAVGAIEATDGAPPAEEASVSALLEQVPAMPHVRFEPPERFDARHAGSRLAMLIAALAHPIDPSASEPLDVFAAFSDHDEKAFCRVEARTGATEARFLMPGLLPHQVAAALARWAREDLTHPALRSHLVDAPAAQALLDDDMPAFLTARRRAMTAFADTLYRRKAEPEHSDRPTLASLLS